MLDVYIWIFSWGYEVQGGKIALRSVDAFLIVVLLWGVWYCDLILKGFHFSDGGNEVFLIISFILRIVGSLKVVWEMCKLSNGWLRQYEE